MQQLVANQANAHVPVNENFATLRWAEVYGNDPDIISALHRGYLGGRWGSFTVAAVDHTFGASTTTYVSAALADGTLNFSTSSTNYNDDANYAKVETVVTSGTAVTSVTDDRGGPGGVHGGGGGVGGGGDMVLADVQTVTGAKTFGAAGNVGKLKVAGTTSGAATIDAPAVAGSIVITLPASTGTLALTSDITTAVNTVIGAAPGALDTLDELAAALADDASFASTMTTALALKAPLASPTLTGTPSAPTAAPGTNTTQIATTAFVAAAAASASVADGDKGDITVSASGATWTIDNDAVTYAKLQNVSATDKVLGRITAGAGDVEEIGTTGSGNVVRATSATLVTPALGTPSALVLTNATGLPLTSGVTGVLPVANYATGTPTGSKFVRDDGALAVPAGVGSTQGRHAVFVGAGAINPSVVGGCAGFARVATSSGHPDMGVLDHDPTTQEYHQFFWVAPKSWNQGTITAAPVWRHGATTTNFGVVWSLQAVATRNDDTIDVAYGSAQTSTDTGGTTSDHYMGPETSAITVAGTLANEVGIWFRGSRVPTDGSDTMAIDAGLLGWVVYFTTNADTDA